MDIISQILCIYQEEREEALAELKAIELKYNELKVELHLYLLLCIKKIYSVYSSL